MLSVRERVYVVRETAGATGTHGAHLMGATRSRGDGCGMRHRGFNAVQCALH